MARLRHGASITVEPAKANLFSINRIRSRPSDYGFFFPELRSDPASQLPIRSDMGRRLFALASVMTSSHSESSLVSNVPAVHTYFGQFIDHDITFQQSDIDGENLPLEIVPLADPTESLRNDRSPNLNLDSVYAFPAPRDPRNKSKMQLGRVSTAPPRPPQKDIWNDLPRRGRSRDISLDRAAIIGDPRNDENLIIAQLHVAFLRAHNALVDQGKSFDEARKVLQKMYLSAIFGDFLPLLVDEVVLDNVIKEGPQFWRCPTGAQFVPLEFSVAGFRFGHSMVRSEYDINQSFGFTGRIGTAPLSSMFTFTAMSGNMSLGVHRDFDTLPENWIIEWHRLVSVPDSQPPLVARPIGTTLSPGLDDLRDFDGTRLPQPVALRLAARNLLRGYRVGLPTGQAIAQLIGEKPLSGSDLLEALPVSQRSIVSNLGFAEHTPLWFYVLAEANNHLSRQKGRPRLGVVGSTIVVETLYNLAPVHNADLREIINSKIGLVDILKLGGAIS